MTKKGVPKEEQVAEIQRSIEALEKQVKKINTLEVYMQRFIKIEERLGLLHLKEKLNKVEPIKRPVDVVNKGKSISDIEDQVLSKVQEMIKLEMEPFQNMLTELHNRISRVENRIISLERKSKENMIAIQQLQKEKNKHPEFAKEEIHQEGQPIIFQEIHVEKLFMDKYEQTNNLGHLGVKELSGHLTIGATYDKGVIPNELVEEWKEEMNSLNQLKSDELIHKTKDQTINNNEEENDKKFSTEANIDDQDL